MPATLVLKKNTCYSSPQPIVSDIDGDGKPGEFVLWTGLTYCGSIFSEIILITPEHPGELQLSVFNFMWNDALSSKVRKSVHIKTCLWELSSIVINFKFLHNIKFYS